MRERWDLTKAQWTVLNGSWFVGLLCEETSLENVAHSRGIYAVAPRSRGIREDPGVNTIGPAQNCRTYIVTHLLHDLLYVEVALRPKGARLNR